MKRMEYIISFLPWSMENIKYTEALSTNQNLSAFYGKQWEPEVRDNTSESTSKARSYGESQNDALESKISSRLDKELLVQCIIH